MRYGLNDEEVLQSRSKYGSNEITKKNKNSLLRLLIESFGDPIIKILLIALMVKVVFLFRSFDWYETIGILIAVFLASFISSISEYGSNKAFERMQSESQMLSAKVYRNGSLTEVLFKDIVVGDVVKVSSGDKIPADGYILKGNLTIDESFLTGESKEVYKKASLDSNQKSEVYAGSVVYKGAADLKITSIADNTMMGKISVSMQEKDEVSPLKLRLRILAKQISRLGYLGAFLASLSYLFMQIVVNNNFDWELIMLTISNFPLMMEYLIYALTLSVTMIIMAVPEGLPMMITLVLSSNMKKMLASKVLVRKLVGIETSGAINVLLCDKTGTLTEGNLKVTRIISGDGNIFESMNDIEKYPQYKDKLCLSLSLNNEAIIEKGSILGGNATDKAIISFVGKVDFSEKVVKRQEFSSDIKCSYVQTNEKNIYFKGASEVLLDKCNFYLSKDGSIKTLDNLNKIKIIIEKYTKKGYRILVNCYKDKDEKMIFISLILIVDKLREHAFDSLKMIKKAGIQTIMITGDAKETAKTIGLSLGMINDESIILTHDELNNMSDEKIAQILPRLSIVARALPQDKSRLVDILKSNNLVVGMTGDGVNDALALKKSDVGFAMGSGCEVAKEASDIVILDNDIFSICKAILYGRTIFKSIRKFIVYQLTVNACALIISIVGTFLGIASPITIIQMLWLNMIMDTFAGLAFSYEAPLKEYMEEKPKSKNEKIINKYMLNQVVFNGAFSSILCIIFLKSAFITSLFRYDENNKYLMTAFFGLFIFLGIINSFLSRTHRINIFAHLLKNKVFILVNLFIILVQIYILYFGGSVFRTYGLTFKELVIIILFSLFIIVFDFFRKLILKKKNIALGF